MADFELAVAKTIDNEGGDKYTDRKNDRGGPTKYGISSKLIALIWIGNEDNIKGTCLYDLYLNCPCKDVVKNLTLEQAKFIYKKYFWDANRYGEIEDQAIADKVFDMAVLMGAPWANKHLQYSLSLNQVLTGLDGIIGNNTLNNLNKCFKSLFIHTYKNVLTERFLSICNKDKTQDGDLKGWLNRVMS